MSQSDSWRLLEEAFAKIQPKDDAERERLERMKERMRAIEEESNREIAEHYRQMSAQQAEHQAFILSVKERDNLPQRTHEALLAGLEEQAELIERIVSLTRPEG